MNEDDEANNGLYKFADKWSNEIADYSFTQVPNLLIKCQGHLGISDGEMITLIQLLTFWFSQNSRVFPSIDTLKDFSNNGYSTIQRRLKTLEAKGFIVIRASIGRTSTYDVRASIKKLHEHTFLCINPPRKQSDYWSDERNVRKAFLRNE